MRDVLSGLMLCAALIAPPSAGAGPSRERQTELEHLLRHDCGSCHGMQLRGGLGPPLTPRALAGKPREAMVQTVLDGRPGTPMPPWRPMLSVEEVRWLVDSLYEGVPDEH